MLDVAIAVAVALAIGLLGGHELPDYDATFALIWGRDIWHGHAPDYSIPLRPAGHPLTTLVSVIGAPLGRGAAAELLRWSALLGAGAFVAATFRFGQALFGTPAGAVAALLLATRSPLWGFSELGFMDAWAAAFVVWAGVLELRSPRRGTAVFVLLALAGLIRPEVWLLAAAYWIWIAVESRRRAVSLLPLAALAPLVWIAWDVATAQTFLASVSTSEGVAAATSSGGHGVGRVPSTLVRYVGGFARPPEVVAAVAGFGLAWWGARSRSALPVALAALNVVAYVIVAAGNGPLEQRYLLVAAAMLLVFAGYAIAQAAGDGIARIAGIALALACIAYAPVDAGRIGDVRDQLRVSNAVYSDLRDVLEAKRTRCALAGSVHVDDVRLRPFVAYWGAIPPERIGTERAGSGTLVALDPVARELSSRSLPGNPDSRPKAPPRWRLDAPCARQ